MWRKGKKVFLKDKSTFRCITSTDSPVEKERSPKRIANKGYVLAEDDCVLSEPTCSSRASVEVEPDGERVLHNNSHSKANRRHIMHPYNVEEKRREALKSYPTSTPTTPPTMNNVTARTPGRHIAWQHIIQTKSLQELPQAEMILPLLLLAPS